MRFLEFSVEFRSTVEIVLYVVMSAILEESIEGKAGSLVLDKTRKSSAEKVSTFGGFLAGAMAACGAVTFTNPIELVKTRMQLQGELQNKANSPKLYKNPLQAFYIIYKHEGLKGLQQGLVCGYFYQIGLNGCRIGFYEPSRYYITKYLFPSSFKEGEKVPQNIPINVFAGFVSGSAGAILASPFFLIKTRMQSFSKAKGKDSNVYQKIGDQTYYRSTWDGLSKIYRSEGVKGLFRGIDSAIIRTGTGSAAQLPLYNLAKSFFAQYELLPEDSPSFPLACSTLAGLGVTVVMNPWDVVLTRIYNQKGDLYSGPLDCLAKTIRYEGPSALYKGFYAQLFRLCPHTILCLTFMEYTMPFIENIENKLGH